jgi:hypothetical protein
MRLWRNTGVSPRNIAHNEQNRRRRGGGGACVVVVLLLLLLTSTGGLFNGKTRGESPL